MLMLFTAVSFRQIQITNTNHIDSFKYANFAYLHPDMNTLLESVCACVCVCVYIYIYTYTIRAVQLS